MKYGREARQPTKDFVRAFQALFEEELRIITSDEVATRHQQQTGHTLEPCLHINHLSAPPVTTGKGKDKATGHPYSLTRDRNNPASR